MSVSASQHKPSDRSLGRESFVRSKFLSSLDRQCTLEGQARYVNVRGSVHWKGVYRVGDRNLGVQNFCFGF